MVKNHVWRPLYVFLGIVALILVARVFLVPDDFGTHEAGYMYGWYRQGNIAEWQQQPPQYRGSKADCGDCHDLAAAMAVSAHAPIQCENCHGPAQGHPEDPPALAIDRSRELCLRCHVQLPYPSSARRLIRGIDPDLHNPELACSDCHNPHQPSLEEM
jgi:predicted CXXCH cytochrome family protein